MIKELEQLFERELNKVRDELLAFREEANIWKTIEGINNSCGNLCLHLEGNLKHFIGCILGGFDYEREREKEFSIKNVSRNELLLRLDETNQVIKSTLIILQTKNLNDKYPKKVFGHDMTHSFFLIHLAMHVSYHAGQMNYLRRIMEP